MFINREKQIMEHWVWDAICCNDAIIRAKEEDECLLNLKSTLMVISGV